MIRIFLKESRAEQLRRELDNAVNGTDYDPNDSMAAKAKESADLTKYVTRYPNGQIWREEYYKRGLQHRTDGPAIIYWHENGEKASESFYVNGQRHRAVGPAYTTWHENGKKWSEFFYIDGKLHRVDGPARISYRPNGQKYSEKFYIDGKELSEEEWQSKYGHLLSRDYLDLSEPAEEYKFTKNRKQPSDPRFAGLDLSDNQPPKKTDDKELEGRAKGLEIEPPKASNTYKFTKNRKPEADLRFKALELDEKLSRIRKEFKRLL